MFFSHLRIYHGSQGSLLWSRQVITFYLRGSHVNVRSAPSVLYILLRVFLFPDLSGHAVSCLRLPAPVHLSVRNAPSILILRSGQSVNLWWSWSLHRCYLMRSVIPVRYAHVLRLYLTHTVYGVSQLLPDVSDSSWASPSGSWPSARCRPVPAWSHRMCPEAVYVCITGSE